MQPLPEQGRIFEHRLTVGPAEVDPAGAVHLDAVARWLQDAAFLDIVDAGMFEERGWIVRRTRLVVERPLRFGEPLLLRTFCSGLAKSVAERRTSIGGAEGAALEAEAVWVKVDPGSRLPSRFSDEFLALYGPSACGRRARSRLRHPGPPADAERIEWAFRAADLDLAGHVNNAVYWQIAEQHLPAARELEIEYRGGAGAGPATLLRRGAMLWVLDGGGELSASIRGANGEGR